MTDDPSSTADATEDCRRQYDAARLDLARVSVAVSLTLRAALRDVTEIVAATLEVRRVSVWIFLHDNRAIRCDYLYHHPWRGAFEGTVLHAQDFPKYFAALETCRVLPIADVADDSLVEEFREPYLRPLGITAMLDAPIYRGGTIVGIVCHEHTGPVRQWVDHECEFAASVADTIARLYEEAARIQAESVLNDYRSQVAELRQLETLEHMAAGVAHDFRNILTSIRGYTDLLARAVESNAELDTLTRSIANAVDRGSRLTQELLSFGHEEHSSPRVLSLENEVVKLLDMVRMAAGPSVDVRLTVADGLSRVFVDPTQVERVLMNVVVNARDAMPDGGTVRIALREAALSSDPERSSLYVVMEVSDDGSGMDASTRARMFEPCFTTKGSKGTGLGLAIVHRIVTRAGGFLEVESDQGRGTTIRIFLPRIAGHE